MYQETIEHLIKVCEDYPFLQQALRDLKHDPYLIFMYIFGALIAWLFLWGIWWVIVGERKKRAKIFEALCSDGFWEIKAEDPHLKEVKEQLSPIFGGLPRHTKEGGLDWTVRRAVKSAGGTRYVIDAAAWTVESGSVNTGTKANVRHGTCLFLEERDLPVEQKYFIFPAGWRGEKKMAELGQLRVKDSEVSEAFARKYIAFSSNGEASELPQSFQTALVEIADQIPNARYGTRDPSFLVSKNGYGISTGEPLIALSDLPKWLKVIEHISQRND